MLEGSPDLPACEKTLSEAVNSIRLLGEIPLSDRDIEILANSVRQKITPNISRGTAYLRIKTPTCFVCFLVGMGRYYDKEAGYWPVVEGKVGPIDLNWRVKWGKIFLQYLEKNDLSRFDEEEGLVYVTPILGHTCIPNCCIDEYFDRVVAPLVNRDLFNPLDQSEIIHDLRVRRKINVRRLELEKKKKEQYEKRIMAPQLEKRNLKDQFEKYREVASLLTEEEECERRKIALQGLENAEINRLKLLSSINEANENIQRIESEGKRLWGRLTSFRNRYQLILEVKPQINDVINNHARICAELPETLENSNLLFDVVNTEWETLFVKPWDEILGAELLQLPLEQLSAYIEQYQYLQENQKNILEKMGILEASLRKTKIPPALVVSLLMLIRKILIWITRNNPVPQPSELQQLHATYHEAEVELQLQQDRIKGLFVRLPVEERLLNNPTPDLHEEFCSLKLMYVKFLDAREKRTKLEEQEDQLTRRIRDLVSLLGIAIDGNLNSLVKRLEEILKDAQQSQAVALVDQRILEKEIRPTLKAARLEHQAFYADLEKLDQQLSEIGEGSTQQGLSLVQEFQRFRVKVLNNRQSLSSRYLDMLFMESELHSQGLDKIRRGFDEAVLEVDNRIQAAKSELEHLERGFTSYPAQYFSIDEPIRRFLLYGGITAEKYLIDSVSLFTQIKSGERVEDISDLLLPNRIFQRFRQWWEYCRTRVELKSALEEETNLVTGEKFRAPQISFDVAAGEVVAKLPPQRLLRPNHGTTVQLDVFSANPSNLIYTTSLKLFNRSRGLVETHSFENIVLTSPSEKYVFRLKSKDNLIHEWEIQVISAGSPFLAFSSSSHKLIKGENLPRSPLILVVNDKLNIHPQGCILTDRSSLFGAWKEYAWYEVDLSTVAEFCLLGPGGQSLTIPLTSEIRSGITLIGGNKLAGVLSDERSVFDLSPEFIRIPIDDQDVLHLLRISLFWEDENQSRKSKHYQADELVNLVNEHDENWIDIPLNIEQFLGADPIGCFTLRVYKPPYLDWQQSFCIIPQIKASFGKEMYLPYWGKILDITTTLTLPETSTFKTDTPARLVSSDDISCVIQTPATEDEISGILSCSTTDGEKITIPLVVIVPKIRWRLQGLGDTQCDQWFNEVKEELWLGDWIESQELFLIVETPWFFIGEVSLVLPGNSISVEFGKGHDQKVRVDLKALEDTLRAGPSLETVTISLKDFQTKILDIPLFTVRTCWLAEEIRCFHYPIGDTVRLDVSWKEKGKANQKAARLWYLSGDRPRFIQEQLVPQYVQEATFRSTATEVKSGKYLVQLESYDPWSSSPVCPGLNDQNTAIIEIVTKAAEKAVLICSVVVDAFHTYFLSRDSYRIHVIGKVINQKLPANLNIEDMDHVLITPLNENWFVGNLEVKGIPEVIDHLSDTNPVKFEYDTQRQIVKYIEDRHGDGAVYCFDCNMLFWHQETVLNEKQNHGKHNYLPIEFRIIWESEE